MTTPRQTIKKGTSTTSMIAIEKPESRTFSFSCVKGFLITRSSFEFVQMLFVNEKPASEAERRQSQTAMSWPWRV
jgi:hypothetical protein